MQASSEAEERREPESNASDAGTTTSDDLLPFLDAEQDNLFLFPEEWHGDASRLSIELKVRQSKRQVFGRCGAGGFAFKVDNVDLIKYNLFKSSRPAVPPIDSVACPLKQPGA